MTFAVEAKNVHVRVGNKFEALEGVSLQLPEGKIVGLIGPSGAGKTTLIRTIVGRQALYSGTCNVFGLPAGAKQLRKQLSYMTQEVSIYNDLTVEENFVYFATMVGVKRKEMKNEVDRLLNTVDLMPQNHQVAGSLSGGQKQRASLAIALIGSPKLLVLDEPTVGLDPVLREELWQLFRELATKGTSLIVSSHVMDEAERCDELLLLRNGKVLAQGSPKELKQQTGTTTVEKSFLKLIGENR